MAEKDTSLRGVVQEVIGETQDTAIDTATNQKGLSAVSGETNTGETAEKEYVEGVDISDIPVEDRPRIKAKLEEKARLLKTGYDTKFQEVAKFKKAQEELIASGLSVDEARDVLNRHIEQKRNPKTNQKTEANKLLDKLIEQTPDNRASLEQLRQIVLEETDVSKVKEDLENIKKALNVFQVREMETGRSQVRKDLQSLSEKFGNELITKYEDKIISEWEIHPNIKTKDIMKFVIPDEEYEQALIGKGKKPLTPEKKQAISSSGRGVSAVDNLDVKKETTKSLLQKILKT